MSEDQPGVILRLLNPADADDLDAEHTPELNEYSWFGFRRPGLTRSRIEAGEEITETRGSFAISRPSGHLLGDVGWRLLTSGPAASSFYYEIGIYVLVGERGLGYGTQAQRLIAEYLFDTTLANRVQASTDVANLAEQRSLEKAGFHREGVMRGFQFRHGSWHDLVLFSKLRGEA